MKSLSLVVGPRPFSFGLYWSLRTERAADRWGMGTLCTCTKMCSNGGRVSSTQSSLSPAPIGRLVLPYQRQDLAKADNRAPPTTHTHIYTHAHTVCCRVCWKGGSCSSSSLCCMIMFSVEPLMHGTGCSVCFLRRLMWITVIFLNSMYSTQQLDN